MLCHVRVSNSRHGLTTAELLARCSRLQTMRIQSGMPTIRDLIERAPRTLSVPLFTLLFSRSPSFRAPAVLHRRRAAVRVVVPDAMALHA